MTSKLILSILILAICSEMYVSAGDLEDKIKEGQEKIAKIAANSERDMESVAREIKEIVQYFLISVDKYLADGDNAFKGSVGAASGVVLRYVEEAIDKNKNINCFQCIIEAKTKALLDLSSISLQSNRSMIDVLKRKTNELENVNELISLVKTVSAVRYQEMVGNVNNCKNEDCIKKLVKHAEDRHQNLNRVGGTFRQKLSDTRMQFNEEQQSNLRNIRGRLNGSVKNCETNMQNCLRK